MATKRVPRARISVSTPELAIIFRGESVSGHPGARGGQNNLDNRPEKVPKSPKTQKQKKQSRPEFRRKTVGEKHKTQRKKQKYAAKKGPQTRAFHLGSCWASRCPLAALLGPVAAFLVPFLGRPGATLGPPGPSWAPSRHLLGPPWPQQKRRKPTRKRTFVQKRKMATNRVPRARI